MTTFKTIKVSGRTHILKHVNTRGGGIHEANYRYSGMALCGICKPGESLSDWVERTGK